MADPWNNKNMPIIIIDVPKRPVRYFSFLIVVSTLSSLNSPGWSSNGYSTKKTSNQKPIIKIILINAKNNPTDNGDTKKSNNLNKSKDGGYFKGVIIFFNNQTNTTTIKLAIPNAVWKKQ